MRPSAARLTERLAVVSFMVCAAVVPAAAAEVRFSPTSGQGCRPFGAAQPHDRVCSGPPGYAAAITSRDGAVRIRFGRPGEAAFHDEPGRSSLVWRGAAPHLGDRIEWRLLRGRPATAIVRIFTLGSDDAQAQQFLVAKVTPAGGCEIARIDASEAGAYQTARDIADSQVGNISCEPNQ